MEIEANKGESEQDGREERSLIEGRESMGSKRFPEADK